MRKKLARWLRGWADRWEPVLPSDEVQWVTVGTSADGMVHVLGSAEVRDVQTTRRPVGVLTGRIPGAIRQAIVPQYEITLTCKLRSFVSVPGDTYQDAIEKMFGRAGISG